MKRIVSGIQATSDLQIGNYLGSIKNWLKLQNEYENFIFVADLHSVTIAKDPSKFNRDIKNIVAAYLACGLDPKKTAIYAQSQIAAHSELAWLLNCVTPLGWMNRMTQFKEKAGKDRESAYVGLYTYPILMAADILLYHADLVPVGEDQKQHLELTRDIAGAFNRKFSLDYFKLPEVFISEKSSRIMSLRDASKKMSKSDSSEMSKINLSDNEDEITNKIRKAKTDSLEKLYYDKLNRPEISNLIEIYLAFADISLEKFHESYESKSTIEFKKDLADLVVEKITPIGRKMSEILADEKYINDVLLLGKEKVAPIAERTIGEVKTIFGFVQG